MSQMVFNPYLPEYEYIPDGEPHVFGDRLYIFGSHDRFNGKKFCLNDYVCYSADVNNLKEWKYEGVIYKKTQDPRMADGKHELWAPDVVQGKDGRYYMYYCPDDKIKSIGVAVCDTPAGKYEFLGIVQDKNGNYIGERAGDTIQFDPGVYIDEDGTIYLYSGNGPRTKMEIGRQPKSSVVMQLEDDMITIKTEPVKMLPLLGEAEGTSFEGHEFFEASSIRKINGKYYLVYSSVHLHELCYAVSDRPDGGYTFGGVVVSNADKFVEKPEEPMRNCYGNDHGSIECVNGKYYVFYHRPTNRSNFSRQACAESIYLDETGHFHQAELTSCGLNGEPLPGEGTYSAGIACNLYGKYAPVPAHPLAMGKKHPYITQDGPDYSPEDGGEAPKQYITNAKQGMVAAYRYFDIKDLSEISVKVRGRAKGKFIIRTEREGTSVGEIAITPAKEWTQFSGKVVIPNGTHALFFCYEGSGKVDFMNFTLKGGNVTC